MLNMLFFIDKKYTSIEFLSYIHDFRLIFYKISKVDRRDYLRKKYVIVNVKRKEYYLRQAEIPYPLYFGT